MPNKVTRKRLLEALREYNGNITAAATAMQITRQAVYQRIRNDPELQQVVQDARDQLVDIAESAIRKAIEQGNIAAIIFTLKTQGKARGWAETVELAGAGGTPIKAYIGVSPDDWQVLKNNPVVDAETE